MSAAPYKWSKDSSRTGLKLMEKMGWTQGKGLGVKEDGRVENVKHSRAAQDIGVGAVSETAAEQVWKSPGVMAAGLNDVLTRLSSTMSVGAEGDDTVKIGGKDKKKTSHKKVTKKERRGYYERKKDRKNVGQYSKDQLREIFGGVDLWASLGSTSVSTQNEGKDDCDNEESMAEEEQQNEDSSDGEKEEQQMQSSEVPDQSKDEPVIEEEQGAETKLVPDTTAKSDSLPTDANAHDATDVDEGASVVKKAKKKAKKEKKKKDKLALKPAKTISKEDKDKAKKKKKTNNL